MSIKRAGRGGRPAGRGAILQAFMEIGNWSLEFGRYTLGSQFAARTPYCPAWARR